MGLGVDIVDIRRIKEPDRFAEGILSKREFLLYQTKVTKISFLAGRFAAKEAFMKAMGRGFSAIAPRQIEVLYRDNNEAPYILFHDVEYEVSIAHDGDYAIAVVIT